MNGLRMVDALPLLLNRRKADGDAELLLKQSRSRQWLLAGTVFQTATGQEQGSAVRVVLRDGRSSLITSAGPSAAGLIRDLERAGMLAIASSPDPFLTLPGPAPGEKQRRQEDTSGTPAGLISEEAARALLALMLEPDGREIRTVKAWVRQGEVLTELANTAGFAGQHWWSSTTLGVLLAGGGTESLVHEELFAGGAVPSPKRFLQRARARAAGLFGARIEAPGSPGVLVLTPEAAAPLLAALGSRFVPRPDSVQDTGLPLPGTRVARTGITLVDDGRHHGGPRSAPFDGEGTPAGSTVLVRDGILQATVHDRRSAASAGTTSTGNAVRDSYRQWPAPGLTTLVLPPQPGLTEDDLLSDISHGLCAMDAAPPDPDRLEAGIFSIHLRGRLISKGRLLSPASPVRFQLPLDDLFPRLRLAAGQPRMIALDSGVVTPSLRLDGVRLEPC